MLSAWQLLCSSASRLRIDCPMGGSSKGQSLMTAPPRDIRTGILRRILTALAVVATTASMLILAGFAAAPAASAAATAPAATQCDPPAFPTGAGFEVNCTITIDNTVTAAGATSSTVTATSCLAAAGVLPPSGCTTTVTTATQLVTSVDQCNGVVDGGGSNVICRVAVVNTIPAATATSGVTVDQCVGSGTGGGTQPTVVCAPVASTTNATITQCNGSANGGGPSTRVQCNVTGAATAEPVTINQCNGSSNGGGSTVTCAATFTNNFVAGAAAPTTTTVPVTPPTTPAGTAGGGGTGATGTGGAGSGTTAVGSGVTGRTGSAAGAGGSTSSAAVEASGVIPFGSPQTGFGGASHSRNKALLLGGLLALFGAGVAMTLAMYRRRNFVARGVHGTP
jgi:hypothetical protein